MKAITFDKKTLWLFIPLLLLTVSMGIFSEWGPLALVLIFIFGLIALTKRELLNKIYFFSIPLSFPFIIPGSNTEIIFPSEAFAGILFLLTVYNILTNKNIILKSIPHPVTIAFLVLWLSLLLSSVSSNLPLVSLKSLIVFSVYLVVFYLQWFLSPKTATQKIEEAIRFYFAGLLFVIVYTTLKHAGVGFERSMAMRIPPPFFSDHTLYGSCLAFFIPMLWYWIKTSRYPVFYSLAFLCTSFAVFLTYSRAVWISLIVVLLLYYLLHLKVSFKKLLVAFLSIIIIAVLFQEKTTELLSQNRSDSKARKAEVSDQLKSVTNISTDVSNLERINRWKSAWVMFSQKPLTGYGPGTYQFNFIPFQREEDKTKISVNYASTGFSQGMGGTAHSQYLLYAAESGLFSLLTFLAVIFISLKTGFQLYYTSTDNKERMYIKAILGGYVTFVFHSFLNNFLDVDKAASLFFLFNAALILLATEKRSKPKPTTDQNGH